MEKEDFEKMIERLKYWNESEEGRDSHITANPIFTVQEKVRIYGFDSDYADKFVFIHEGTEEYETVKEFLESFDDSDLKNVCVKVPLESVAVFLKLDEYEQVSILNDAGYGLDKVYYKEDWKHVNTHLTMEAAKAFIKRKQHDHGELMIYVESLYWCWEFKDLIKGLLSGEIAFKETK
jgi:hypothetical protein